MAGYGMAQYFRNNREPGWRGRSIVSLIGGIVSTLVVLIFAVVKFNEGAWLVVVLFPIFWLVLMRLNKRYRDEARALDLVAWVREDQAEPPHYARHLSLIHI